MADMELFIYPWNTYDDYLVSDATSALQNALDDVIFNTKIGDYNLTTRYDHPASYPQTDQINTINEFYTEFKYWRNNVSNYIDVGCHLSVTDEVGSGGAADPGDDGAGQDQAFVTARDAVMGGTGDGYFQNGCIQEPFHTFIDKGLPGVDQYYSYGGEHDLGKVYSSGDVSPMATGYEESHSRGYCSSGYSQQDYSHGPTYCTEQSLEYTYEDNL